MPTEADLQVPDLKQHLLSDILAFWARHSVDRDHGGFITHLDRGGSVVGSPDKFLVMQTRMIYSFSAGFALGGPSEWLSLADQGLRFFLQRFRDGGNDGWHWSVTRAGRPREQAKRTYGHAFAAYALAEYARVAGQSHALAAAVHTWSLIRSYLWDSENEGVIEACDRAWNPTDRSHTMGTHLHVLEAVLALSAASGDDRFWPQIRALCDLIVDRMVDRRHQCGLEKFHPDWAHNAELSRSLVNYGHNLEAAWLLLRVHRADDAPAYRDTAQMFLDYVVRYGLDSQHGGVFSHGPFEQPASEREKVWWVQTEAMVAFLLGYLILGDRRYWDAFRNVVAFALRYLHDAERGEWYAATEEDGTPLRTDKGSAWKAAYHVTQTCAYADQYLAEVTPPS
jgi:mannobiose 2-epimerase